MFALLCRPKYTVIRLSSGASEHYLFTRASGILAGYLRYCAAGCKRTPWLNSLIKYAHYIHLHYASCIRSRSLSRLCSLRLAREDNLINVARKHGVGFVPIRSRSHAKFELGEFTRCKEQRAVIAFFRVTLRYRMEHCRPARWISTFTFYQPALTTRERVREKVKKIAHLSLNYIPFFLFFIYLHEI